MTTTAARRGRRLLTLTVTGMLTIAACGGDDGGDAGGDSGGSAAAFCDQLRAFEEADVFGEEPDFSDPASVREQFEQGVQAVDALAADAPSEIAADVATVRDALSSLVELFEEYDYDLTRLAAESVQNPEITETLEAFGSEDLEAAGQRITQYTQEECGVGTTTG